MCSTDDCVPHPRCPTLAALLSPWDSQSTDGRYNIRCHHIKPHPKVPPVLSPQLQLNLNPALPYGDTIEHFQLWWAHERYLDLGGDVWEWGCVSSSSTSSLSSTLISANRLCRSKSATRGCHYSHESVYRSTVLMLFPIKVFHKLLHSSLAKVGQTRRGVRDRGSPLQLTPLWSHERNAAPPMTVVHPSFPDQSAMTYDIPGTITPPAYL